MMRKTTSEARTWQVTLFLDKKSLKTALETRIGAMRRTRGSASAASNNFADGDEMEKSAEMAFKLAESRWAAPPLSADHDCPMGKSMDEDIFVAMKESARTSQKNDGVRAAGHGAPQQPALRKSYTYRAQDITKWMEEVRARKSNQGDPMDKPAQTDVVHKGGRPFSVVARMWGSNPNTYTLDCNAH